MKAGTLPECHCFSSKWQKLKVSTGISYSKSLGQAVTESMNIIVIIMHKKRCLQMAFLNEEKDSPVFQGHWTLRLGVISALNKSINWKTKCKSNSKSGSLSKVWEYTLKYPISTYFFFKILSFLSFSIFFFLLFNKTVLVDLISLKTIVAFLLHVLLVLLNIVLNTYCFLCKPSQCLIYQTQLVVH